jgi:hypothetical protein
MYNSGGKQMKTLKVLALILALFTAFSTTCSADFPDVSKDDSFSEAISVLSQLKILEGYEDGTFKPDATITRAEFSAVVCRLMAAGKPDEYTSAVFSDVPSDHWAISYISYMSMMDIVEGNGDGTFAPDNDVKYEEAVKMLVTALGYGMKAESLGGYPTGYIMVANQFGITMGTFKSENGNRSTVARLVYNAITAPLTVQSSPNGNSPDTSFLYSNHKIIKAEANIKKLLDGNDKGKAEIEFINIDNTAIANGWYAKTGEEIIGDKNNLTKELPDTILTGDIDLAVSTDSTAYVYISIIDEKNPILIVYYEFSETMDT